MRPTLHKVEIAIAVGVAIALLLWLIKLVVG